MTKKWLEQLLGLGLMCAMASEGLAHQIHQPHQLAKQIAEAKNNHQAIPNVSQLGVLDVATAYRIQTAFVRSQQSHDSISGFKACLTTHAMQARFGINRLVFGVLFKSGDRTDSPTLVLKPPHRLTIETELGFITRKPIYKTVQSIDELKSYIGAVVPVLEVPDVGFAHEPFNAIDLTAGNGAAHCYLINRNVNWINRELNAIAVTLFHNGNIVNQGQAQDALGDQWEALRWLVNQVLSEGWTIKAGNLLITGALGEAILAEPGDYIARFDEGNEIGITITSS